MLILNGQARACAWTTIRTPNSPPGGKGTFEQFGGAERDLLNSCRLGKNTSKSPSHHCTCHKMHAIFGIARHPVSYTCNSLETDRIWAEFRALASRSFQSLVEHAGIDRARIAASRCLGHSDAVHLTSSVASLEFSQMVPKDLPIHYHCLELHRGLHEDVLVAEWTVHPSKIP